MHLPSVPRLAALSAKRTGGGSSVSYFFLVGESPLTHAITDLNLPLTAIAMGLVVVFLRLKVPKEDLRTKMGRMDWM